MTSLAPSQRAGASARRPQLFLPKDITASGRHVWPCGSCAIAEVIAERGLWSGTVWSSVSSSQRILSLWLSRLSTDRIVRQSRDAQRISSPVIVFGKRGNLDIVVAFDAAAERLGLRAGLRPPHARPPAPTPPSPPGGANTDA